jgi:hypothetical protein
MFHQIVDPIVQDVARSIDLKAHMESLQHPGKLPVAAHVSRAKRIVIAGAALLAAASLAIYFFTRPAATLAAIQDAAATKNFTVLNELVDFPSLRASVKASLVREMEARVEPYTSAGARIGALLGNVVIGPMVELVVSPLGLAFVLDGYTPRETASSAGAPANAGVKVPARISYETRWDSLAQYVVVVRRDDVPVTTLILRRHGVFAWKLDSVDLAPRQPR